MALWQGSGSVTKRRSLHDAVEAVLRELLGEDVIDRVYVERDIDDDGDAVLRIKVIYDRGRKALDARKTSTAARLLRPELTARGESGYPVIAFVSKADYGASHPEAA